MVGWLGLNIAQGAYVLFSIIQSVGFLHILYDRFGKAFDIYIVLILVLLCRPFHDKYTVIPGQYPQF